MKHLSSDEIREEFLGFFERHDHKRILGSSIIPKDDPTLLFVNSGMAPLKSYFTGAEKPACPDLCNIQPCVRTKDIDDVGDRHHLTFFEMLGSWSIGHYFKEGAVDLAFRLLVDVFGFAEEKLFVTVYSGNPEIGLEPDHETAKAWRSVGFPEERIIYLGQDNFWGPAGETGPCGPCTEVFFDTGEEFGPTYEPGGHFDDVSRYIEIWNAGVFMQLDKKADGSFGRLPIKSVDTGSGIERMAMILQGVDSVYQTDLMSDIKSAVDEQVKEMLTDPQRRMIADHVRSASMIMSEGVNPGNEGRNYIPRRLIRKCVALIERAGISGFDYGQLLDVVINRFKEPYPLLVSNRESIVGAFAREVSDFQMVIGRGLRQLERLCSDNNTTVSGKDAFDLFATYGLPIEITKEFVQELGGSIDEEDFHKEYDKHREISRAKGGGLADELPAVASSIEEYLETAETDFVGYEQFQTDAVVLGILKNGGFVEAAEKGDKVDLIFDKTPFYAEGGGQVGDQGQVLDESGALLADVSDTQKVGGTYVHSVESLSAAMKREQPVRLVVDRSRRTKIMANHSCTHLLHSALRTVLGSHVHQAGSRADEDRLRFDFTHEQRVSDSEIQLIERMVNGMIRGNHARDRIITSYDDAISLGALAFFGDKYGDEVSVVRFGDVSTELCGGTHVPATGDIGLFRIVSESSVAKGVRRIVAVTGEAALKYTQEQNALLSQIVQELRATPDNVMDKLRQMASIPKKAKTTKAAPQLRLDDVEKNTIVLDNGLKIVAMRHDVKTEELAPAAEQIAKEIDGVVVLAGAVDGKASLAVAVAKSVKHLVNASHLLKALAKHIEGQGGGSPTLARGGGANPANVDVLIGSVGQTLQEVVSLP